MVHIDAPWGGGKTSFANYLKKILNPYRDATPLPVWFGNLPFNDKEQWPEDYRRPWHIVEFNAWKHQELSPPWWAFYQAIRKQGMRAVSKETNQLEEFTNERNVGLVPLLLFLC